MNFSLTAFGIGYNRDLIPAPGAAVLEGIGDIRAIYNPAASRPSWQKRTEIVIADLFAEGQPLDIAPRSALRRTAKSLSDASYTPQIGIELEGYVLEQTNDNKWVPWNTPSAHCYGTGLLADPSGHIDDIMEAATYTGIPIETTSAEYDSAQFEFTIRYDDP